MLFTFPSRYSFTIGLTGVFSLAGWSRPIRAGFLVPRVTQDTHRPRLASDKGLSPAMARLSSRFSSPSACHQGSYNPGLTSPSGRFGLFPGRSPLLGESLLFSLPPGTKMFQFPGFASPQKRGDNRPSGGWVVPFGHPRVNGHLHLTADFRSLSRPSSPP